MGAREPCCFTINIRLPFISSLYGEVEILIKNPKMKDRNYGIDLLRIVTMFMIVNLHVFWYGGILRSENLYFLSAKYNIVWILEIICYVAVNCYALISGFVGIESRYKYSNIVLLWLRVVFYSISLYLIGCIFGIVDFNFKTLVTFCFPVVNSKYWYFTAYFCLFFFMPILNSALENMEYKLLRNSIIMIIIIISVLPFIYAGDIFLTRNGSSFVWLMVLYLIGGFIKKYNLHNKFSNNSMIILFAFCIILELGSAYLTSYLDLKGVTDFKFTLISYTSSTMLLSGISLLIIFSKLKVKSWRKIISFLSPLCFSVYLIHEHEVFSKRFIVGRSATFLNYSTLKMLLYILITDIVIFVVCIFVDYFRELMFKKLKIKKRLSFIDKN